MENAVPGSRLGPCQGCASCPKPVAHARPAACVHRADQPGGTPRKTYPFLRTPMVMGVCRPFAYPFLRPRPQKRVRMYTNGHCCMASTPPLFATTMPAAYPFLRATYGSKQRCVPISACCDAETGTPARETGPQKQVRFTLTPMRRLAETGTPSISDRLPSPWVISLFVRRNRYGT